MDSNSTNGKNLTSMTSLQALSMGLYRTSRSKRIILFAWFINVMLTLFVVLPMFNQLNTSIRETVKEEELVQHMDENWYRTFKFDTQNSEIAQLLDTSIFGAGPFLHHFDGMLQGKVVVAAGNLLYDLLTTFRLRTSSLDILTLLALLSMLINTYLAGGFISAYAGDYPVRISEFLMDGARYFGRFFRISLIAFLGYYLLFSVVVSTINDFIGMLTFSESSEWIPFLYYQIKHVLVLIALGLMMMCVDYARIRLVLEDRYSAVGALGAGIKFVFGHFFKAALLYFMLCLTGLLLILACVFIEKIFPQTNFWTIFAVFVLQQLYTIGRMWVHAGFFASQMVFFQKMPKRM